MLAESKRIMISLPESLLAEVDDVVMIENRNRSEFIREAINSVLHERRRKGIREQMRIGYQEMAQLNLAICHESFATEEEVAIISEEINMECQR